MNIEEKIYADFLKLDEDGCLILSCYGTKRDLAKYKIELQEGLVLTLYTDDGDEHGNTDNLVVQGVAKFNPSINEWIAKIDWEQICHESELLARKGTS